MAEESDSSSIRFDASGGSVRGQYDWSETAPSVGVVETVARATDRSPTALDSLSAHLDADALDALLQPPSSDQTITVTFSLEGKGVRVDSDGEVVVRDTPPE